MAAVGRYILSYRRKDAPVTVPPIFNDRYPAILHNADIDAADLVAGATYEIGLWAVRVDSDVTFVSEPAVGEINIPESGELHVAVGNVSHDLASVYICIYIYILCTHILQLNCIQVIVV